jgi:CRISPR-associated protein Csa3
LEGYTLVASVGFTVDFILRRVAAGGEPRPSRVVAAGLYTDPSSWRRVEEAARLLGVYLSKLGVDLSLERLPANSRLVAEASSLLHREAARGPVELYLTGGPRLLVVALYTAALTLPPRIMDRVRIVSYGEGFPARLEVRPSTLARLASIDEASRRILEAIRAGARTASSILSRTGLPRSTLYKKLRELREAGLVEPGEKGVWMLPPHVEQLIA